LVKSVRTWNASDEVNILIEAEAPKGRGFSEWANKKIMLGSLAEKNPLRKEPKPLVNLELEI